MQFVLFFSSPVLGHGHGPGPGPGPSPKPNLVLFLGTNPVLFLVPALVPVQVKIYGHVTQCTEVHIIYPGMS